MPRVSEFNGIAIYMYAEDHPPPHFHARYGGRWAKISIATGKPAAGTLPKRVQRLLRTWSAMHRDELNANWTRVRAGAPPALIEPL
jgi:hypothetical protein